MRSQLAEERRRRGRVLRRLEYCCVAAEHGREGLPRVVRQGRVERHDQRGYADRPPRGYYCAVWCRRRRRAAVEPATLTCDEEAHSTAASTSPSASSRDLPVSSITSSAASSRRACSASASSRTSRPRSTGVRVAHPGWAERPAATAAETSTASDRATVHSGEPSAGRNFSNVWPDAAGAARPTMRFAIEGRRKAARFSRRASLCCPLASPRQPTSAPHASDR